ncbi:MAG: hypothetical protein JHC99_01685 [Brevundimonas sp.]|nr:hypothetical protein [Brevundimonas sp.]
MFADPRYYLLAAAVFASMYFLAPHSIAIAVSRAYPISPGALMRSFQHNTRFRAWSAGIGLAGSISAPTLVGTQPVVMAPMAIGMILLGSADFRQLLAIAREAPRNDDYT